MVRRGNASGRGTVERDGDLVAAKDPALRLKLEIE